MSYGENIEIAAVSSFIEFFQFDRCLLFQTLFEVLKQHTIFCKKAKGGKTELTIEKEYNGDIQANMNGSFSNLVAKTFKVITKKKVFIPGKFANSNQQACVKCALR